MANPRGDKPPQLQAKINAIAKDAQGLVDQAEDLDPPGALKDAQASLVTALEYRVTGLTTLSQNLPTLLQGTDLQTKAAGVAKPMQRFLASDVIYDDSFKGPAILALQKDDITGVEVPPLQAFLPNAALASAEGAKALIPDLSRRSASTGGTDSAGNLRGTSLESTVAKPSDTRLTVGQTATVQATEDLKWSVTIKNGGDFDESNVVVKASFSYPATPNDVDTREVSIKTMPSGETVSVEIPGPGVGQDRLRRPGHADDRGRAGHRGDPDRQQLRPSTPSRSRSDGRRGLDRRGRRGGGRHRPRRVHRALDLPAPPARGPEGAAARRDVGGPRRPPGEPAAGPGRGSSRASRDLESLVERQGEVTERSLRSALRFQGMVRYDAYRDMGGSQSWSIALIDGNQTGAVVTSLHARDHARVYLKELVEGTPGQRLSPEEDPRRRPGHRAPRRAPPRADAPPLEDDQAAVRRPAGRRGARRVRVGYLGPPGTFCEEALLELFGTDGELEEVPFPTIGRLLPRRARGRGARRAGADREHDRGIGQPDPGPARRRRRRLDPRRGDPPGAAPPAGAGRGRAQRDRRGCSRTRTRRPSARSSCAPTCRGSRSSRPTPPPTPRAWWGAARSRAARPIGTLRAASLYGCEVLARDIADVQEDNSTRFVLLGTEPAVAVGSGRFRTSIICHLEHDRPGALLAILQEFAMRAVNLTKLESRPDQDRAGPLHVLHRHRGQRASATCRSRRRSPPWNSATWPVSHSSGPIAPVAERARIPAGSG